MMKLPELGFDPTDKHASPNTPWIVRGYTGTNLPAPPLGVYATHEEAKNHHPAARPTGRAENEMKRLKEAKSAEKKR